MSLKRENDDNRQDTLKRERHVGLEFSLMSSVDSGTTTVSMQAVSRSGVLSNCAELDTDSIDIPFATPAIKIVCDFLERSSVSASCTIGDHLEV